MEEDKYIEHNKASWDKRVPVHLDSEFYALDRFRSGESSLQSIELELLGDVSGKKILHLQCHFGMDTLSLARMGAEVTGVDFSEEAIKTARTLTTELGLSARFVCADIYSLENVLEDQFDLIFTSYGVIGWLPDMQRWAQIINHFLKPGGTFILVEFHPVVWMFDNDFLKVEYSYFNAQPIIEQSTGTYTDREAAIASTCITWNHSLDEVWGALLSCGLLPEVFKEYDYSPYPCFNGIVSVSPGKYYIEKLGNKIPMVYSLRCAKPGV